MATKKAKKKVTKKKARPAAKKRSPVARTKKSKRSAMRTPKRASARKPARRSPVARKAVRKKARSAKPSGSAATAPKPMRREDRPGHLDPQYAAMLRAQSGPKEHDPQAFLDFPRSPSDDLAEELGEEVVGRATSGEDEPEPSLDQVVPEEVGGPFVETQGAQEFAPGTDASNPKGAKREPFPRT